MKALTVRQPWASLIAEGIKTIETRSWRTHYRGRIAIHAAARPDLEYRQEARGGWMNMHFAEGRDVIRHVDGTEFPAPLGAVVATATLTDCLATGFEFTVPPDQEPYGDFTPGRWAWLLDDIEPCDPVPAKGRQGLWEWTS